MDTFWRNRIVTSTRQKFIASNNSGGLDKFYAIHNLGPAKVTIYYAGGSGPEIPMDIRSGDFFEVFCMWADIQIATGESFDGAVIQWQPVN